MKLQNQCSSRKTVTMWKVYKLFLSILSVKEKRGLLLLLMFILISTILESLTIAILYPIINTLQNPSILKSSQYRFLFKLFDGDQIITLQLKLLIVFFIFIFIKSIISYLVINRQISFSTSLNYRISSDLYKKYIHYPYSVYLNSTSSKFIRNLTLETTNFFNFIINPFLTLFSELILLSAVLIVLFFISFKIVLFLVFFFTFIYFFYSRFSKNSVLLLGKENQKNNHKLIKTVQESFSGIREIKLFKLEKHFINSIENIMKELSLGTSKNLVYSNVPRIVLDFLFYFVFIVILIFGYFYYKEGSIFPIITSFAAAGLKILPGINKIVTAYTSINFGSASMGEIAKELNQPVNNDLTEIQNDGNIQINDSLELKNISFSYDNSLNFILKNINLKIQYKSLTAIIGESGSGKSTLMHIILGLLKSTSGSVYSNNECIDLTAPNWLDKVGYLPQTVFLADDTIKNNITLFQKEELIDKDLLLASIKSAQLDKLLSNLDTGLEYVVGERGSRLSGGEIQRIGIARLLYNKKQIIIFDEPTSALDTKTESEIIETIVSLKKICTMIIVTHNRKFLNHVDHAYELQNSTLKIIS